MKCTLTAIIVALLSLAAVMLIPGTCSSPYDARLQHIDSLMDSCPQAAYDSLSLFDSLHLYDDDKASRMRLLMLKAKAQNKLYLPMPSDTIFNEVVSYYDRHGSANDRMLSRYLLGCIYRDMRDAPMALECFIDAAEQADTTSSDCDFRTLFTVYGQMASIYQDQYLPDLAMQAYARYSKYALKSGDIYSYIRGMEFIGGTCFSLGDTARAVSMFKDCIKLYTRHGMNKAAASASPVLIKTYIARGQYDSAHIYIKLFENKSGLFVDERIVPERMHYYYTKGLYQIGIGKIDAAEYYFRKLLGSSFDYEACKGLISVTD